MTDPAIVPKVTGNEAGDAMEAKGDSSASTRWFVRISRALWKNTDSVTKWIQVVALLFAAVWTFMEFSETVVPGFGMRAGVGAQLGWDLYRPGPAAGSCTVTATFNVENQGVKSFDVDHVWVRVWRDPLKDRTEGSQFIDLAAIEERKKPLDQHTYKGEKSALNGHYAPKMNVHEGFTWLLYGTPPNDDLFLANIVILDKSDHSLGEASAWKVGPCVPDTFPKPK